MLLSRYAPFVYDVWKNAEVLGIISKIAGVELVPEMDFEIAHINISVKSEQQKAEELEAFRDASLTEADEGIAGCPWEDDKPIVDWHTDSYPFVCVTMLSDCTNMIGGETALRTGDGGVVKVRGPQMVGTLLVEDCFSDIVDRDVPWSCKAAILSTKRCVPWEQLSVSRW